MRLISGQSITVTDPGTRKPDPVTEQKKRPL